MGRGERSAPAWVNMDVQAKDLDALRALAREIDLEPDHVFQVCKTALSIFDQTHELHLLGAAERPLLEAGALLHDCGFQRGPQRHHKHSRDLILELELPGFSDSEKKIVACVARYHRKAAPEPTHAVFRDLSPQEQAVVSRLAAILRVADGLDRLHVASAQSIRVEREGEQPPHHRAEPGGAGRGGRRNPW